VPGPWFRRSPTQNSVWLRERRRRRLRADDELVRTQHPGLSLVRHDGADEFVGSITIGSESGIKTQIPTRILVPDTYPADEPVAFDVGETFPRDPDAHINPDGSCCLWLRWDSGWDGRQPDGILKFIDQLLVFFHKQLLYEATGRKRWPGDARGHAQDGYKEYVCEALNIDRPVLAAFIPVLADWAGTDKYSPCPCRSGKRLRWCHGPAVEALLRKVGRRAFQVRVTRWLDGDNLRPSR